VLHAVTDVNDSEATCIYDRYAAGDDDVNVTDASSQSTSDAESSDLVVLCGLPGGPLQFCDSPLRPLWYLVLPTNRPGTWPNSRLVLLFTIAICRTYSFYLGYLAPSLSLT